MNNFETVVRDVDSFVGDFISKLPTKAVVIGMVWVFVVIYMWARILGVGLLFIDFIVMLWVLKNSYLAVKAGQELWKRMWRGNK